MTLPLYVAAVRHIVGERAGIFVALGSPAVLWNVTAGQNGFLTAALIGGTLGLMQRRPALAGLCLGLLSYKPHFGLLFPIALIAVAQWRVIGVAALVPPRMAAPRLLVFGAASWQAFFDWMPVTSRVVLGDGGADFSRLQSLFGLCARRAAANCWRGARRACSHACRWPSPRCCGAAASRSN